MQGPRDAVRARDRATLLVLAALTYLPLLLQGRGRLAADTRQAVYLDPGRFIADALSMWDPSRDLGTVTHQNIVVVWPMGIWYWLAASANVPLWVAQRLWTASIIFLAGAGVLFLARSIGWGRTAERPARFVPFGPAVAAVLYAMSPYVIQYGSRTSVLLLPWAALPWLLGLTDRALRTGGWRHPALLALVVPAMAVNATALALVLLGPVVWAAWSVFGERGPRQVPWRAALGTAGRTAALGIPLSAWWVVALAIEGRYGLPLLDFTETIDQVATTSSATEVLRGLGYWVPYLQQHTYPEVSGASAYLDQLLVLAAQLAVVVLVFVAAVVVRWVHRSPFVLLLAVGVVIGVGAYPVSGRGPLAAQFGDLARSGGIGLALRSTTRAAPLAVLAAACLIGAMIDAGSRLRPRAGAAAGLALVIVAAGLAPSFHGELVDPLYSRPDPIPSYWQEAIDAADAGAGDGRLLELPGTRYAAYRWGNTYEPITAGLAETPTAWREQIPYGGAGSAEVLAALDSRVQEGRLAPEALAPVARLLGVSELLIRNDLEYERYDTVAPDRVWSLVDPPPPGLGPAAGFGPVSTNEPDPTRYRPDQPQPADPAATYPAVGLVPVLEPTGLVRRVPLAGTVVLDGDADGMVEAAAGGAIDGVRPVVYAASTLEREGLLDQLVDEGAEIVLTDSNRRRVDRWRSTRNTAGITLTADDDPAAADGGDGGEASLEVFDVADGDPAWQSVAEPGGAHVTASRFGNPLWFESGTRPAAAMDGDPTTAWLVGPAIGGVGDHLDIALEEPTTTDRVTIRFADDLQRVSVVDIRLDGEAPIRVELGPEAFVGTGQVVLFPRRSLTDLSIELVAAAPRQPGAPPTSIGIAEVGIADPVGAPITVDEVVRLPEALAAELGPDSVDLPMRIVLTRLVGDTADPALYEEEPDIRRRFTLPTARQFDLTGTASVPAPRAAAEEPACRDDLLVVDGQPVPVRLQQEATRTVVLACAPLDLAAGEHELRSTSVADIDIDQLVLTSAAGGGPGAVDADGRPVLTPAPEGPEVEWEGSLTEIDVTSGEADGATWLILEQSRNDGWQATADGEDLGAPVLVNGFANGFVVPAELADETSFALRWTPQRSMRVALAVSGLAALVAAALAVRGRRWRGEAVLAADEPLLVLPLDARPPPTTGVAVTAALGAAVAGGLLLGPVPGILLALLVGVACRWRYGQALLVTTSLGAITWATASVVLGRIDDPDENRFDFFKSLAQPHRLALAAIVLLVLTTLLDRGRARTAPGGDGSARSGLRRWWREPVREDAVLDTDPPAAAGAADRRRYVRASALAVLAGTAAFVVLLLGSGAATDPRPTSDFYDAQAHALLDGRLDIDAEVLGIEGFVVDGRTYMYQGPFPALLRLPIAAVTDELDGRLAGPSMVVAFAVAGAAVAVLLWQGRRLVRGAAALGTAELIAMAAVVFAATAGSALLPLAAQVSVYHEGAIWGVAAALVAFALVLQHRITSRRRYLVLAAAAAVAALCSRASVGIGPVLALGLLAGAEVVAVLRSRPTGRVGAATTAVRPPGPPSWRRVAALGVAAALPIVLYCGLNVAKFGTLASVPWGDQVYSSISVSRQQFLAENEGSFFGLQFAPSTIVAYLRPDGVALLDHPPYVGFRTAGIGERQGIGGALFDKVDATGSIPASFPLLVVLAGVGVVALVRTRGRSAPAAIAAPVAGAAVAAATIFVFGFIAERYVADALPLLVLLSAVGLPTLLAGIEGWRPSSRRWTVGLGATLLVAGAVTAAGMGFTYQAVYASPGVPDAAARYVELAVDGPQLPFGRGTTVSQGPQLPPTGEPEDLFVVGDCAGLYVSDGSVPDGFTRSNWKPVLRTPEVGAHDLDATFAALEPGTLEPLLVGGDADEPLVLAVEHLGAGRVRFRYLGAGLDDAGEPVAVGTTPHHLELAADPGTGLLDVTLDGEVQLTSLYPSTVVPELGENSLDGSTTARFAGTLEPRPIDTGLCRRVLASG